MKINKVTDDWIELDSDGTIWISPIDSAEYYIIGQTQSKRISLERVNECFKKNKLTTGKYNYYYVKAGEKNIEKNRRILDSDKVFTKVYAKGSEN